MVDGPGFPHSGCYFCFLKKLSGVRKLTTFYLAKNDHRWVTCISLKTINIRTHPRSRGPATVTPRWTPQSGREPSRVRSSREVRVSAGSGKLRSFSAVSAPIFASKYAFYSIFQNLPDYLAEIFEIWHHFVNFATFAKILLKFHRNC